MKTRTKGEEMNKSKEVYINELEGLIKYQFGFDLLMEYWDCLPDEEKPKVHKKLTEMGL